MDDRTITSDDAIFFMDMVNSARSPNHAPKFYQVKSYYKILDDPNSNEFQRFIKVYNAGKYILKEREQMILDDLYGINKPRVTHKKASIPHNITQERVRQICYKAELKIVTYLLKQFKGLLK